MKAICNSVLCVFALVFSLPVVAEDPAEMPEAMDHSEHVMDTEQMDHSEHMKDSEQIDHSEHMMEPEQMDHSEHMKDSEQMDHSGHSMDSKGMDHADHTGQGAAATTATQMDSSAETGELRDPHAYAEGEDFGPLGRPKLADEKNFGAVLIHRLEAVETDDNSWWAFDGQAWYGRTYDRANLKLEGEVDSGKIHELSTELLWSHAVAPFWDTQLGIRHDSGEDPDRTWIAFGIQGLAPYWFHLEATLYAGERGDTAAGLEAEYDLLFTQRLILQPRIEMNLYGQNDEVRETGSGLSDLAAGLRVRYEFTRHFAPYVGVEWAGLFGGTADFARAENKPTEETRFVAGVHLWF